MRIGIAGLFIFALFAVVQPTYAAPFKAEDKNPQVVAYYPTGSHGIVGEKEYHEDQDLVMKAGKGGVFQQWFYGTSLEGPNGTPVQEGDHSVWKLSKDGTCANGWYLLQDVNTSPDRYWGDYLEYGADYCVKTNDFHAEKH